MESGAEDPDAQIITEIAKGNVAQDDERMRNYLIRQYQKKRYS